LLREITNKVLHKTQNFVDQNSHSIEYPMSGGLIKVLTAFQNDNAVYGVCDWCHQVAELSSTGGRYHSERQHQMNPASFAV